MPRILIVQQISHEGLGTFAEPLAAAGCAVTTVLASSAGARWPAAEAVDGLIVLGGPMGVDEQARHPFLRRELVLLRDALRRGTPILGVCLGSQLLAHALGAAVRPNGRKEIGWYPLMREPGAEGDPLLAAFESTETVFQWHGDTFALPPGAVHLASSPLCAHQAFRHGPAAYGLQFHVEVSKTMIDAWLRQAGNRRELAALRGQVDPAAIRRQTADHLARLTELARHVAAVFGRLVAARPAARSA